MMAAWLAPSPVMIDSLLREPILRITTIKNSWSSGFKMDACCFPDLFLEDSDQKWLPLWRIFTGRWGISPIGMHWTGFQCILMDFFFRLTMISLDSNFNGMDYRRQAGHHSIQKMVWRFNTGPIRWNYGNAAFAHSGCSGTLNGGRPR